MSFCFVCLKEYSDEDRHVADGSEHIQTYRALAKEREDWLAQGNPEVEHWCDGCPCLGSDETGSFCRLIYHRFSYSKYYDSDEIRWYTYLEGYYNSDTGQCWGRYPDKRFEKDPACEVVLLRPHACIQDWKRDNKGWHPDKETGGNWR